MRWIAGWAIFAATWPVIVLAQVLKAATRGLKLGSAAASAASRGMKNLARGLEGQKVKVSTANKSLLRFWAERTQHRAEIAETSALISRASAAQAEKFPLPSDRQTIFLMITCGQAVRNFLLSGALPGLKQRFNVVILSPYAASESFRSRYEGEGVHVLPWFHSFRTMFEKFFHYYLMKASGSRTHKSWLENLELRASEPGEGRLRFMKHRATRRASDAVGGVIGPARMHALYASYFHAYLDRALFKRLFDTYRPSLVISTTAQHAEAWPLTYHGRKNGCATLANILSWDNTTTKPAMDISCDYYTVWSEEMKQELAQHFPHIKATAIVTGAALFDLYYQRPGAEDRSAFMRRLGLNPDLPYVLWTTNTPAGMPDEHIIVREFWGRIQQTELAGKLGLLVRLHPKESNENYLDLQDLPNVALTSAGDPHWSKSDHWMPGESDMALLLNSMIHAAVSVNVASTMSLESFAVGLPTINVAFKSTDQVKDHGLLWSFDMYHASDHYRALVENGAVEIVRSMDALVDATRQALQAGPVRQEAMQRTLAQKAAYCDGTAADRFCEVVESIVAGGDGRERAATRDLTPVAPAKAAIADAAE